MFGRLTLRDQAVEIHDGRAVRWFFSVASMSMYEAMILWLVVIAPVSLASSRISSVPCG